jgi:hypothetical protein
MSPKLDSFSKAHSDSTSKHHMWLRHAEASERHRQAAARYAAIRRHIEQLPSTFEPTNAKVVYSILESIGANVRKAPSTPAAVWRRTQDAYGGHGTAGGRILSPESNNGA